MSRYREVSQMPESVGVPARLDIHADNPSRRRADEVRRHCGFDGSRLSLARIISRPRTLAITLLMAAPLVTGCKSGGESARWLINGWLDPTQTGNFGRAQNAVAACAFQIDQPHRDRFTAQIEPPFLDSAFV